MKEEDKTINSISTRHSDGKTLSRRLVEETHEKIKSTVNTVLLTTHAFMNAKKKEQEATDDEDFDSVKKTVSKTCGH